MKRPQLQALQSRSNLLGMLALASLCFVLGAHWGQRRSLQAAPAALAASGPLQQAATALEVAVDSGGVAAASSAAQDLGSLRGQAREVLESNTAAGSSALEAAADAQPATAAGGAGEGAQQAAKWGSNSDPQPDVVTRVLEIRPAPAKKVPGMAGRIPKILHQIFIPTITDPSIKDAKMWPHHQQWAENCRLHYSEAAGWEYRLWDREASERLVEEHYPQFLSYYRHNITLVVEKTDMLRYLVLHKYGGLYLDSDVDCWREGSDMLEGYDTVVQGTHQGEVTGSMAIAAAPGMPWALAALELVMRPERSVVGGQVLDNNNPLKTIARTGPILLADSLAHVGLPKLPDGLFPGDHVIDGKVYKVWPARTWFHPCHWWERSCRRHMYQLLGIGQMNLTRLVGAHRFAGSWIPGKENGAGIVNVTEELCNPQPDSTDGRRRQLLRWYMPHLASRVRATPATAAVH